MSSIVRTSALILALCLLAIPATVVRAAGPPPPMCEPEGNYCVVQHSRSWTDNAGASLSVTWSTDIYSGNIVSEYPSPNPPSGTRSCPISVNPSLPNSEALVSYDYTFSNGTTNAIGIYIYADGSSYPYDNYGIPTPC